MKLEGIQPARTQLASTPLQWVYCCFCQFNLPSISALSHHPTLSLTASLPPSLLSAAVLPSGEEKKKKPPATSSRKRTSPYTHTHTHRCTWQRIWLLPLTFAWTWSFMHALVNKGLSPTYSTHEFTHTQTHKFRTSSILF